MTKRKTIILTIPFLLWILLTGCQSGQEISNEGVSTGHQDDIERTLGSLERVDEYPLYTMHYYADFSLSDPGRHTIRSNTGNPAWACSLFASLGADQNMLYGRNFDWDYSPALILFTYPSDGYASVSMVDLAYFGFHQTQIDNLIDLSLEDREPLLETYTLPFDGMNEHGLVVAMAAVPPGDMLPDPQKETIGSIGIIREILDHAASVEEALSFFDSYNIDFQGGPPIHYLVADSTGDAVLIEFFNGEMIVIPNDNDWHLATNFLVTSTGGHPEGQCSRYDRIEQVLGVNDGKLTLGSALDLLASVANPGAQSATQWSIIYDMTDMEIHLVMGRKYNKILYFSLN